MPRGVSVAAGVLLAVFGFLGTTLAMITFGITMVTDVLWRLPDAAALLIGVLLMLLVLIPVPVVVIASIDLLGRVPFRTGGIRVIPAIAVWVWRAATCRTPR